jgi:hypothetical protein
VYLGGKTERLRASNLRFPHPESTMRKISLLLLLTCACASPSSSTDPEPGDPNSLGATVKTDDYIDMGPGIERASELPIGAFLGEIGRRVQAWTRARLDGNSEELRLLGEVLEFECARRQGELVEQLESGAPRNRALAAVALGFAKRRMRLNNDLTQEQIDCGALSLGPLLAATEDTDPKVAANALMGLGILARADTPIAPIARALVDSENTPVRSNAAFAMSAIAKAGNDSARKGGEPLDPAQIELARETCIRGLGDADVGVRTQCAATLGIVGDESTIPFLGDRLDDEIEFVGQAASIALVRLGRDNPRLKGRIARLLAGQLDLVRPSRRDTVLYGLILLAGRQMGDSTAIWQDWAGRLPAS